MLDSAVSYIINIRNSLGLRKIGQTSIQPDNTQTRGKIAQIGYLLQVTEVE